MKPRELQRNQQVLLLLSGDSVTGWPSPFLLLILCCTEQPSADEDSAETAAGRGLAERTPFGQRMAVKLLMLLLMGAVVGCEAQSGGGDSDSERRILCSSHVSTKECSLTCQLMGGSVDEDDEDGESDSIQKITACSQPWIKNIQITKCLHGLGNTVSSPDLNPLLDQNLTVYLKGGGQVSMKVDLKKIVKPRKPEVWNVTFDQELKQAVIYVQTPYDKDFLKVDNQIFQLHIYTTGVTMVQNISSNNFLQMSMTHLQKRTKYSVRVRAIPHVFLQGTWSDWSKTFKFLTPGEASMDERQVTAFVLIVSLVSVVVVTLSMVFFWKNKIFAYMWPNIPHPKQTLVQICKPNKGLLLNLNPEVFSSLKVFPQEEPAELLVAAAVAASSFESSSAQSSNCRSVASASTEELELSALLSRTSSDSDASLLSTNPSPVNLLQGQQWPEPGGATEQVEAAGHQQEEAYVTMSSFYKIQ